MFAVVDRVVRLVEAVVEGVVVRIISALGLAPIKDRLERVSSGQPIARLPPRDVQLLADKVKVTREAGAPKRVMQYEFESPMRLGRRRGRWRKRCQLSIERRRTAHRKRHCRTARVFPMTTRYRSGRRRRRRPVPLP